MRKLCIVLLTGIHVFGGELSAAWFKDFEARMKKSEQQREAAEKAFKNDSAKMMEYLRTNRVGADFQNPRDTLVTNHGRDELVTAPMDHGVSEIGIERTGCYGTCPAYTFIMKSDGTYRYEGGNYAKPKGKKSGRIRINDFHWVASFLKEIKVTELKNEYQSMVTDSATVFTMFVVDGKRKIISIYAESGPAVLWGMERLIDQVRERALSEK